MVADSLSCVENSNYGSEMFDGAQVYRQNHQSSVFEAEIETTPLVHMTRLEKTSHDRNFRPWDQVTDDTFTFGEDEELIVLIAPFSRKPAMADEKPLG